MNSTNDIVQRLWNLCHVLRDDGITYHEYVIELTYLLFLKIAHETQREGQIPRGYRWNDLKKTPPAEQLTFYSHLLHYLGTQSKGRLLQIYSGASTSLHSPRNLERLISTIDTIGWYNAGSEGFGELYEGLLDKNASEKKSGAGQYFTPRPLIDCIVRLVKPLAGEIVQDPAAGTAGFLVAADRYIKEQTGFLTKLSPQARSFQIEEAFWGIELVHDTHRLGLMNLLLHGVEGSFLFGDALSETGLEVPPADVILTNPPFGTKKGGNATRRRDLKFQTSNKQFAFLEHVYRGLKKGGRAAVVVPDNVLFEENSGSELREDLMQTTDLHTILRLPTGIFYAPGVKTNVLFFTRSRKQEQRTKDVWIYDMRTGMPAFGRRTPLISEHFSEFEELFGDDPYGRGKRKDQGERGRFRKFSRSDIKARQNNLDITWLNGPSSPAEEAMEARQLATEIAERLRVATSSIEELHDLLAKLELDRE